jgi:hypothetical protein
LWCLPKYLADLFLDKLKAGEIDPEKLAGMSSADRRSFFVEFLGDSAEKVNALFESKLLLKSQQEGLVNWAKQIARLKPEASRDILARVEKMEAILTPETQDAFLADLAAHRLGATVTMEEAGNIMGLSKLIAEKRLGMESGERRPLGGKGTPAELEYGRARVQFANYVNNLKKIANKPTILEWLGHPGQVLSDVSGVGKAVQASMDNSAIFRQGWKALWTNPVLWGKNAIRSFSDIIGTVGGKPVMDEVNADILSRPTYDLMKKARLAVATIEESYPVQLPEKIPLLGRFYKASEVAFTAFVHRLRADIFDYYVDVARKSNLDLTDTNTIEGLGKVVNSLTGRGSMGRLEPIAGVVNNVFFSPRLVKSHFDVLTAHLTDPNIPWSVKKLAAVNLVKIIGGTAAVLAIAKILQPDSVELDPRSSDFGQIRVGDTRFDVSGGMRSLVTLAARLITLSTKGSASQKVMPLNSGKFGSQSGTDVVYNFFENKLSPAAQVAKDLWFKQRDFQGKKITLQTEALKYITPLSIQALAELQNNPDSANVVLAAILDMLGISVNTYAPKPRKLKKL